MKEENETIIRALNRYGRVPKTYELLNEIDRLYNIINKAIEYMQENKRISLDDTTSIINFYNNLLNILRGNKE